MIFRKGLKMKPTTKREPTLLERTNAINAEQDDEIEGHIQTLKTYGVPMPVISQIFWAKIPGGRCRCNAVRHINETAQQKD
jgi:hypothetical protein